MLPSNKDHQSNLIIKVASILVVFIIGIIIIKRSQSDLISSVEQQITKTQSEAILFTTQESYPTSTNAQIKTKNNSLISTPIPGFYVSLDGNDSNPGTINEPWKTINKAAKSVEAGDTVYIRGGTFYESIDFNTSGTSKFPITIQAYRDEIPIIDGRNQSIPSSQWDPLVRLSGDYISLSGIEVRYSAGMGLVLSGKHDIADQINAHHNFQNGILITGDYSTVQNSIIWDNCLSNLNGESLDGWASGLSAARAPNFAVIRKNIVYGNWGEGVSTYEANGTLIEDNIVYDNWSANIYISDATNIMMQRNFIYVSGIITGGSQVGIMLGDEKYKPPSAQIEIINNIVYGANRNFYWWQGTSGGGMDHVTIAHNTFVNSSGSAGLIFAAGSHQSVEIKNNIIQQDGFLPIISIYNNSELHFSNNLWSKRPHSLAFGSGDLVINPKLSEDGSQFSTDWFLLTDSSPAIDHAENMSNILNDYFGNSRDSKPDIGAIEFITPK